MNSCLYTAAVLGARFRGADSCLLADANGNLDPEAPPANYGRRRSRAVLYQLSGHYKQEKIKTKLKLNNVSIFYFVRMYSVKDYFMEKEQKNKISLKCLEVEMTK